MDVRLLGAHREEAGPDLDRATFALSEEYRSLADQELFAEPLGPEEHDDLADVALVALWVGIFQVAIEDAGVGQVPGDLFGEPELAYHLGGGRVDILTYFCHVLLPQGG
ncbi:hypothetical protein DSECCO2_653920 [anaerobic digester metagenome]